MKPVKKSVAIVILDAEGRFLTVQRAKDDDYAGQWGLPAASLRPGEDDAAAAQRAAKDKLGLEISLGKKIGYLELEKDRYFSHLTEYFVHTVSGSVSLEGRDPTASRYADYKFTDDVSILIPAARAGSLCSRIFLGHHNITWQ